MTNDTLEKKINRMQKDLAFIKKMVLTKARKAEKRAGKDILTDWAKKQIKLGQADVKAGRIHSLAEVKKRYGL